MDDTSALLDYSSDEIPEPLSPAGERSYSELRLLTPPKLGHLGSSGASVEAQLDVFRLKGELQVSNFQVKNKDDSLGRISRILAEKEAELVAERQKTEMLLLQVMELNMRLEAGATGRLEKQLEKLRDDYKHSRAEATAATLIKDSDGNLKLMLDAVRDRELEILSLRDALHTTQRELAVQQQDSRRLTRQNEDILKDMKLLLANRTQINAIKSELLKLQQRNSP